MTYFLRANVPTEPASPASPGDARGPGDRADPARAHKRDGCAAGPFVVLGMRLADTSNQVLIGQNRILDGSPWPPTSERGSLVSPGRQARIPEVVSIEIPPANAA